ncbi:MAG: glycosyltransferase [Candidatus Omnitrophica bacterium]|nr:glycosyltransferase [Candidatus Omnitrophota bacterium]
MKVMILSALPRDTGCWLRAAYLADSLKKHCDVVYVVPFPKGLPFMLDVFLSLFAYFFYVLASDADVFIGVKPFPNITIPLLFAKYVKRKFIVVDVDDLDHGYFSEFPSKVILFFQRIGPRFFDIITYHNDLLRDFIVNVLCVNEEKLYKLDQGVDLRSFFYKNQAFDKNSLFYMAHLNLAADLSPILKAVKLVQDKIHAPFIIAGGGPKKEFFERLAKEIGVNAIFIGSLSKEAIVAEMAKADICLAYYELKKVNLFRASMKVREYLAMRKKVVCNDYGEFVRFKKYTYQCSSSVAEYADRILQVLRQSDGREEAGERFIKANYDWNQIGESFFRKLRLSYNRLPPAL